MNYNLHTHTSFSDGEGSAEECVSRAIEQGFTTLGFTEHAPLRFPDGFESKFRVPFQQVQRYVDQIQALKARYRGTIDIHLGFELEFYPAYFEDSLRKMREWGIEYLILGQHFVHPEHPETENTRHVIKGSARETLLAEYVSRLVEAMETEKFTYIAHPDMFLFQGDPKIYQKHMREICVAAKRRNIPLEINMLGIRRNNCYPNELFWQLAAEEDAPVTFGADAHAPENIYDANAVNIAKGIVEKYGLRYIGQAELKNI